jgi:hypothetical protein
VDRATLVQLQEAVPRNNIYWVTWNKVFSRIVTPTRVPACQVRFLGHPPDIWAVSSIGRASDLHSEGCRFDPDTVHHSPIHNFRIFISTISFCGCSSGVEHLLAKQKVASSKLAIRSKTFFIFWILRSHTNIQPTTRVAEWSSLVARQPHKLKVGGSNPPSATNKIPSTMGHSSIG